MHKGGKLTLRLHPDDNVIVARAEMTSGTEVSEEKIASRDRIPFGHKIASVRIDAGAAVRKYGQIIGFASRSIQAGEHVHEHNMSMKDFDRDYVIGTDVKPEPAVPIKEATFQGIVRPDGSVATRNYIGVLSSVNCSATVAHRVADLFRGDALDEFPNIDGVVPVTYGGGCGFEVGGEGYCRIMDSFAGYLRHPNFAGILLVGLGCEDCTVDAVVKRSGLRTGPLLEAITIQDTGGTPKTIKRAEAIIREMLPAANRIKRQPVPAARLIVGLECGGSDAYSGITANPALGAASDRVVLQGGTVVLSETPEIYGAEHLLIRRAVDREVAERLIDRIRWWKEYAVRNGGELNNNPTLGNKAGGITTILEKSLGAAAKGGTTNLMGVYRYAEPIRSRGFVFMDTPGFDPPSVTGMVAGGANVICFTTGRGSAFGFKPVPSIKLASNTPLYQKMEDDMDINCGPIADGQKSIDGMGEEIFRTILAVASGSRSKSELHGVGDYEFVPWQIGAVF
ncbi:MAG: altronate dehydratase [Desulfobacteraceae bacterium]|nr:MAG: altronate dehydratase [Desulfobacteraceae bacterium]